MHNSNLEKQRSHFEMQVQNARAKVTSLRTSNSYIQRQEENNRKKTDTDAR